MDKAFKYLNAPDEKSGILVNAIIARLENPDSLLTGNLIKGENQSENQRISDKIKRVRESKKGLIFREKHKGNFTKGQSKNARMKRMLSLEDKQDVAQTIFAMLASGIDPQKYYTQKIQETGEEKEVLGLYLLFRACRKAIRINGGNHDISKAESIDNMTEFDLDNMIDVNAHPEEQIMGRLDLSDQLEAMRKLCKVAFENDQSRQKAQKYKSALAKIEAIEAGFNLLSEKVIVAKNATARINENTRFLEYLKAGAQKINAEELEDASHSMKMAMTKLF